MFTCGGYRERMSRLQLALNVERLDDAIAHYTKVFGVGPAKVRPGYANFAIDNPPLKLVLIENPGADDSINHLGVEVQSVDEVRAAHERVTQVGLPVFVEGETTCCYAVQDKFWIEGGEHRFEVYTVLADSDQMQNTSRSADARRIAVAVEQPTACCAPTPVNG
jgi:predicted enzyme related to lactoylglutathione lyase